MQVESDDIESVDIVHKNSITGNEELVNFDQKTWLAASNLFNKGTESIIAGGVRGGLQLFENKSIGSNNGENTPMEVKIYPNPVFDNHELYVKSNQDVTMELVSILGQQIMDPFKVRRYTTSAIEVGHLQNGTYILRSKNEFGISSSQLFLILR